MFRPRVSFSQRGPQRDKHASTRTRKRQGASLTSVSSSDDDDDPDRKKFSIVVPSVALLLRFGRTLGVIDILFLCLVVIGISRMLLAKSDNDPTISLKRDYHRLQRAMDSSKVSSLSGTVLFRGTRACNTQEQAYVPSKPLPQQEEDVSASSSASSSAARCQIHFPLDIATSRTNCQTDFCVRTSHRCDVTDGSSSSWSGSGDAATWCHRNKHHHAALLRPLWFDGSEQDNDNKNITGQLLVLADGINELGHELAETVVLRLPVLVLDPFRKYAKANTKISRKILPHAFSAMDVFLCNEKASLWKYGGASTLVILQYGATLFLASTGTAVGFLARYDRRSGNTKILKRAAQHAPESPSEGQRIRDAGGIVGKDAHSGEYKVFVPKDSNDQGIRASRALGGGRWKYRGVISVPTVEEVDLQSYTTDTIEGGGDVEKEQNPRLFVVAASTGIAKSHSEQSIADRIGRAMYSDSSPRHGEKMRLDDVIKSIMEEATSNATNHHKPGVSPEAEDLTLLVSSVDIAGVT